MSVGKYTYFKEYIENLGSVSLKTLPLIHTTPAFFFRDIMLSKKVNATLCKVFNESYLYSFYGIPAYRIGGTDSTDHIHNLSVCLVLDLNYLPNIERVFPFDSGAVSCIDEVKNQLGRNNLEDFELSNKIDDVKKLVSYYYTSNQNYLDRSVTLSSNSLQPTQFEIKTYLDLISSRFDKVVYDDRISTIEVIFKDDILLNSDSIKHIILPERLYQGIDIQNFINKDLNITNPGLYYTSTGSPSQYFGSIYQKYREYADSNKIFQ